MKSMKTRTGLVALAIALPLSLAACGSSSDNTAAAGGSTPAATSSDAPRIRLSRRAVIAARKNATR